MKNITVSVDEETHRLARMWAAELETSVSALVREFLRGLAAGRVGGARLDSSVLESESERRRRLMSEVLKDIQATRSGFRASDNIPRGELYEHRPQNDHSSVEICHLNPPSESL